MTEYKPGTVAKATVRGVPDVTVMRHEGGGWFGAKYIDSWRNHDDRYVTDVRPLVVLDPRGALGRFTRGGLRATVADLKAHGFDLTAQIMADIAEQTRPAIEEPKGLGAVVEDDKGERWLRYRSTTDVAWKVEEDTRFDRTWEQINAVRVLSEGVQS